MQIMVRIIIISASMLILLVACGGSGGGHLVFWKGDSVNEFHQFKLPNSVKGMALHPDGMQVATAHYDGRLRLTAMREKAKAKA